MQDYADHQRPLDVRRAGVLLHVTSLPGRGDLGPEAYRFVDFLAAAGCTVWQVLPLVPTQEEELAVQRALGDGRQPRPDQPASLVRRRRGATQPATSSRGARQHADWLEPYVEFVTLREPARPRAVAGRGSRGCATATRRGSREVLAPHADRLAGAARRAVGLRRRSGASSRTYAAERGVLFFGDLPIFVSHDSADVWASRELFQLDAEGQPITVTGVPPDYFAADGQRWNNPHYDWDARWRPTGSPGGGGGSPGSASCSTSCGSTTSAGSRRRGTCPVEAPTAKDGYWVTSPGQRRARPRSSRPPARARWSPRTSA